MNDFDKGLRAKYSYKSYKAHFEPIYRVAQFIKVVLLFVSCVFSSWFFSQWFGFFGDYAIYAGFICSALLAGVIGVTTDKVLLYWSVQRSVEVLMASILVFCMGLNIYGDFKGAERLGENIAGEAPIDTKTAEISGIYQPQIASIDAEINDIESKEFYWCASHKKAHKCSQANFYIDKRKDADAIAKIADLKAQKSELLNTMNTLLGDNGNQFNEALSTHSVNVTQSKDRMRFGSLVCTVFFIAFSIWAHNYGLRAISETPTARPLGNRPTHSASITQGKNKEAKKVKKPKAKAKNSEPVIYDEYREELTKDELDEELRAMREKERNAGK